MGQTVAVIDFETTGMSPGWGDRPTEIAVVLVADGCIVGRYESLMNPGRRIPWQIVQLTGISDAMVASAPPVEHVMREAARFAAGCPVVAHNAAFDRRFWEHELGRLDWPEQSPFACTMLLARRLYPHASNHRLGTLVELLGLPRGGRAHRAMADAEMAAHLWLRIASDVRERHGVANASHELLARAQRTPRHQLHRVFATPA